jgi:hypothetical protein
MSSYKSVSETESNRNLERAMAVIYDMKHSRESSGLGGIRGVFSSVFGKASSSSELEFYRKLPEASSMKDLPAEEKASILQGFIWVIAQANADRRQEGEFFTILRNLLKDQAPGVVEQFKGLDNRPRPEKGVTVVETGTEMTLWRASELVSSASAGVPPSPRNSGSESDLESSRRPVVSFEDGVDLGGLPKNLSAELGGGRDSVDGLVSSSTTPCLVTPIAAMALGLAGALDREGKDAEVVRAKPVGGGGVEIEMQPLLRSSAPKAPGD